MSNVGVSLLDLPSVRGNPFDNRPIEASRAHDLVGRRKILHRWRDHIHSGSPRMILLVGESGSGRTSMINTISSQTQKKYIGQYLSEADDQVRTVLHEIVTHFGTFQSIPTMNQLSQKLISIFDEENGPLPLIALDYPSQIIDINLFLSRISPILSRLRAMVIVSLTETQYLDLNEDLKEIFDEPDHISNFTKSEIQEMVNNRMRIKSKEKWNINSQILESIHSSTGGNPRDVIRILKRLVDEKRDLGSHGTLESLMSWQRHQSSEKINTKNQIDLVEKEKEPESQINILKDDNRESIKQDEIIDDFIDIEPPDLWETDERGHDWSDDFSLSIEKEESQEIEDNSNLDKISNNIIFDEHVFESELEDERIESIDEEEYEASEPIPQHIPETELFMEPGTEPPKNNISGNFGGLKARLAKTSLDMKENMASNNTPIIFADNTQSQPTLDKYVNEEKKEKQMKPITDFSNIFSEAPVDRNIEASDYDQVMSTEDSEWSVEPSFSKTLPDMSIKSTFGLNEKPMYVETQSNQPTIVEEPTFEQPIFEEIEESVGIIQPIMTNEAYEIPVPVDKLVPSSSIFSPRWDPDMALDTGRFYSLSDAEKLILQIAATREISPSDNELQARLEVGRPRLSQLYNSLYKSGMLSVRKQGRTRLFKLSNAAAEEF